MKRFRVYKVCRVLPCVSTGRVSKKGALSQGSKYPRIINLPRTPSEPPLPKSPVPSYAALGTLNPEFFQ